MNIEYKIRNKEVGGLMICANAACIGLRAEGKAQGNKDLLSGKNEYFRSTEQYSLGKNEYFRSTEQYSRSENDSFRSKKEYFRSEKQLLRGEEELFRSENLVMV